MLKNKGVVILRIFGKGMESASRLFSNYVFYFILELMQASSLVLDSRGLNASSFVSPIHHSVLSCWTYKILSTNRGTFHFELYKK